MEKVTLVTDGWDGLCTEIHAVDEIFAQFKPDTARSFMGNGIIHP
jgi:hypothetical protein